MPKLKISPAAKRAKVILKNIEVAGAIANCRTDKSIAEKAHISTSTYCLRKKNPLDFRLDELLHIADVLGTTVEWLVSDHGADGKTMIKA